MPEKKQCRMCRCVKPLDNFSNRAKGAIGRICLDCGRARKLAIKRGYSDAPTPIEKYTRQSWCNRSIPMAEKKTCADCQIEKTRAHFAAMQRDWSHGVCRDCKEARKSHAASHFANQ